MNELKNIMNININDSTINAIGEHDGYDEIMGYIITKDIINKLNEFCFVNYYFEIINNNYLIIIFKNN
jgi:hypothetical protein